MKKDVAAAANPSTYKMDYFKILGVEKKFDLDEAILEKNYLLLQNRFHPDRQVSASKNERIILLQKAKDINAGYETLKSPLERAEYLMQLNGIKISDRELSKNVDSKVLYESMEMRENLEITKDIEEVKKIESEVKNKIEKIYLELVNVFRNDDFKEAMRLLIRGKYLDKFLEECRLHKLKIQKENNAA